MTPERSQPARAGCRARLTDRAEEYGITVASMKRDWKSVSGP